MIIAGRYAWKKYKAHEKAKADAVEKSTKQHDSLLATADPDHPGSPTAEIAQSSMASRFDTSQLADRRASSSDHPPPAYSPSEYSVQSPALDQTRTRGTFDESFAGPATRQRSTSTPRASQRPADIEVRGKWIWVPEADDSSGPLPPPPAPTAPPAPQQMPAQRKTPRIHAQAPAQAQPAQQHHDDSKLQLYDQRQESYAKYRENEYQQGSWQFADARQHPAFRHSGDIPRPSFTVPEPPRNVAELPSETIPPAELMDTSVQRLNISEAPSSSRAELHDRRSSGDDNSSTHSRNSIDGAREQDQRV